MKPFIRLPQQEIMFRHMIDKPSSACFADPGLGKTAATLEAISHLLSSGAIRGALIVAPKRVVTMTWPDEFAEWKDFSWMRMADLRTPEGMRQWAKGSADIYLINYDQLPKFSKACLTVKEDQLPVDMVVWDEVHRMRGGKKWFKSFFPHWTKFKRHVGLTGTPAPNSYLDLFYQIKLLDGGERLGSSLSDFKSRFFDQGYMRYDIKIKPHSKKRIEELISDIAVTLTSEKYLHLPPTAYHDIEVTLPPAARKSYSEMERDLLTLLKSSEVVAINSAVLVGKLLQITSGAVYDEARNVLPVHSCKLDALEELAKKLKRPLLVATAYVHEKTRILARFPGAEVFREDRLAAWNAGKIPMWVADPGSVGVGLNLQKGGDTVVWFSPTYSCEEYIQTNCRLIRQGQTSPTNVYRIIAKDTIDEAVVETLRRKQDQQTSLKTALKNLQRMRSA